MALRKYRHSVTGKVVEVDEGYASAIKALEPVDQDARVDVVDCCGGSTVESVEDEGQELESAGVDTPDWPAIDEPTDTNEGE